MFLSSTGASNGKACGRPRKRSIAAQKSREDRANETQFELKQAYLAAKAAKDLADLYTKAVVPQSSLALESSMSAYQVGSNDFLTVLSNFSTLLNYETDYYRQVADYNMALAQIESLVGVELAPADAGTDPQDSQPELSSHCRSCGCWRGTGGEEMKSKNNVLRILALVAVVAISLMLLFGKKAQRVPARSLASKQRGCKLKRRAQDSLLV